jgi:hypothetical protein
MFLRDWRMPPAGASLPAASRVPQYLIARYCQIGSKTILVRPSPKLAILLGFVRISKPRRIARFPEHSGT